MLREWSAELTAAKGDEAVLALDGELDVATAPRLRGMIARLLGQGIRRLELDCSDLEFVDSTGIGVLLWAAHRLTAAGGELSLSGVHGDAASALAVAGVDAHLAVRG